MSNLMEKIANKMSHVGLDGLAYYKGVDNIDGKKKATSDNSVKVKDVDHHNRRIAHHMEKEDSSSGTNKAYHGSKRLAHSRAIQYLGMDKSASSYGAKKLADKARSKKLK